MATSKKLWENNLGMKNFYTSMMATEERNWEKKMIVKGIVRVYVCVWVRVWECMNVRVYIWTCLNVCSRDQSNELCMKWCRRLWWNRRYSSCFKLTAILRNESQNQLRIQPSLKRLELGESQKSGFNVEIKSCRGKRVIQTDGVILYGGMGLNFSILAPSGSL